MVIVVPLKDIQYVDYPELEIDEHESTEMPFRYMKDANGLPCMPEVSCKMSNLDNQAMISLTRIGHAELDQGGLGEGIWRLALSDYHW